MAGDPPLKGLRVLELAGLAPAPFCGLLLASYGASVLRIDRPHPLAHPPPSTAQSNPTPPSSPRSPSPSTNTPPLPPPTADLLTMHKSSICLDLKHSASVSLLLSLLPHTDILIDPFRPGVLESILEPHLPQHSSSPSTSNPDPKTQPLLHHFPRLILTHLTGFRRTGPYASMAGHDINYLSLSGTLSLLGPRAPSPPQPPANLLADFAGGGLVAFAGILLALLRRSVTGRGQVIDANMVDGVSALGTFARLGTKVPGFWDDIRGSNLLDGGAPYYGCYETKTEGSGKREYVAVGALEDKFFAALVRGLGFQSEREVLPPTFQGTRSDKASWEYMRGVFSTQFKSRTRREWEDVFTGTDACVTPVLGLDELERGGYEQRPLVGLSESPARTLEPQEGKDRGEADSPWAPRPLSPGQGGEETLRQWVGWRRGREFGVEGGRLVKLELELERERKGREKARL